MVPSNLIVLAKFGLCSNCSQKIDDCLLAGAPKIFASARMLGFSLKCRVYSVSIILKTKTDTGNLVFRQGNWETLGKHLRARTSGKILPRSVDVY